MFNFALDMIKRGDIVENVTVEGFAAESKCVARIEGQVVFITQSAPGDVVDLRITKKKKFFLEAVPINYHSFSSFRETPFCSHYGTCGGCKWQHITYDKQLEFKQQQVEDQFERIGKLKDYQTDPILGSKKIINYRNKLEYTFTDQRWLTREEIQSGDVIDRNGLGFHKPGQFDKVLDVEKCFLQPSLSNDIRNEVKSLAIREKIPFYNLRSNEGFLRNLIIRNSNSGEWMVILQVKYENTEWIELILNHIQSMFSKVTCIYYIINPKNNESYSDLEAVHFAGKKFLTEKMEGIEFRISPKSFFQTNSDQAYQLYLKVIEFAHLNKEQVVYDLYSGTGTIANFLAKYAKKIIGLEYIKEAVEDAKTNAAVNKIGNTYFEEGDIAKIFNEDLLMEHGKVDVIITDPPRAGMHKDVIKSILLADPERIVYISCNPGTQARDIELLGEKYKLIKTQAVDMFPHTHHIENIALLERL